MRIDEVAISKKCISYLKKRKLFQQYKKQETFILEWAFSKVQLGLRSPKSLGIYYFRINKQYRAFATKEWNRLVVFKIYDHKR